jgi:hypothetical protein
MILFLWDASLYVLVSNLSSGEAQVGCLHQQKADDGIGISHSFVTDHCGTEDCQFQSLNWADSVNFEKGQKERQAGQ